MIVSSAEHPSKNTTAADLFLKNDILITVILFALGLLSRLPFVGHVLYHWDSVNFALGLQHFDVANGQPHVPGYILYIFLGRIINTFVNDPQLTLAGMSVVSSGLAIAALYELGRTMFNREIGLLAALFLASSPLFWFYGEIALPHSLDAFVLIVAIWLLYRVKQGAWGLAIPAAIWLAFVGGLRPQSELFLAPLAIYAGWSLGWRRGLVALLVLVIFSLAWLLPLLWLTGGPARYFEIMGSFTEDFNTTTSLFEGAGWFGLSRNLMKLTLYTLYGWGFALIPVGIIVALSAKSLNSEKLISTFKETRFWFLLLWLSPTLAFYILVHMGQQGLVFVFLPALLLLSAAAVYSLGWSRPLYRQLLIGVLVLGNTLIFVGAPTNPLNTDRVKLLTAETLQQHDMYYLARLQAMHTHFPQSHTLILSSGWRFPQYYLPQYLLAPYGIVARWELGEGASTRVGEIWVDGDQAGLTPDKDGYFYAVLFDMELIPFNESPEHQKWITLPGGQKLAYLRFTSSERLYIGPQSFRIVPAP